MKYTLGKAALTAAIALPIAGFLPLMASANTISTNFETTSGFTVGNINNQQGWTKTGPFDANVVATSGVPATFGMQSLQISNAVTSGTFGDQTFAAPLTDSVGETAATAAAFSVGTKQQHFETQFDIASANPNAQQPDLSLSVSPDRGDGSRMSYLRFEDQANGIHVFFDDVTDVGPIGTTATFNESDIATLDRSVPHTIKLTLDTLDGPNNDVVNVWIDGVLRKTGKSWEDYYRFDPEASAEQSPRIVKTLLFREANTPNAANIGKGFLIDNLTLTSGPIVVVPTTGSLTVEKDTIGGDDTFAFTGTGSVGNFQITTTQSTGSATFSNLVPGTYTITEAAKGGWTETDAGCASVSVTAGGSASCTILNTKNAPGTNKLGAIVGTKYEVGKDNGKGKDKGHHPLAGVTIYLDQNDNGTLDNGEPTSVTDKHGNYRFLSLSAGTYHVREVVQSGWQQISPASGVYDVALKAGQVVKHDDFANKRIVAVTHNDKKDKHNDGDNDKDDNKGKGKDK